MKNTTGFMEEHNEQGSKDTNSKEGLDDFFSDLGDEAIEGEYDEVDQYIDEVMALLENYGDYSGGIITINTIYAFLKKKSFPDIILEDCFEIISRLRINQIITDEIVFDDIPNFYLYVFFKDLHISEEMKTLIRQFALSKKMTKTQLLEKSSMEPAQLDSLLMEGQKLHLITTEGDLYHFPGIPSK
jgi:hypothetical protein